MATSSLYLLGLKILESYLTLAHLPHPICHEILLAISLKHIQNPTTSHHLCCHHPYQTLILQFGLLHQPPNRTPTDSTLDPPKVYFQHSSHTDHVSPSWLYSDHVSVHALITWLIMHWSRGWSCTDHVGDNELITWLIIQCSRGWSCTNHVVDDALIT